MNAKKPQVFPPAHPDAMQRQADGKAWSLLVCCKAWETGCNYTEAEICKAVNNTLRKNHGGGSFCRPFW